MDKKLSFNELDILNAAWGEMKGLKAKKSKDAMSTNAMSKGLSSITKYLELKAKIKMYKEKNPSSAFNIPVVDDAE